MISRRFTWSGALSLLLSLLAHAHRCKRSHGVTCLMFLSGSRILSWEYAISAQKRTRREASSLAGAHDKRGRGGRRMLMRSNKEAEAAVACFSRHLYCRLIFTLHNCFKHWNTYTVRYDSRADAKTKPQPDSTCVGRHPP